MIYSIVCKTAAERLHCLKMLVAAGCNIHDVNMTAEAFDAEFDFKTWPMIGVTTRPNLNGRNYPYLTAYRPTALRDTSEVTLGGLIDMIKPTFPPPFEPIIVPLNDEYSAKVLEDGQVQVGCQTFKPERIIALAVTVNKIAHSKINL